MSVCQYSTFIISAQICSEIMMLKFFLISVALLLLQNHIKLTSVGAIALGKPTIWTEVRKGFMFLMDKYLPHKFRSSINPGDKAALMLKDSWRRRGLRALDRVLSRDVIMITDNIALIKRKTDVALDAKNYSIGTLITALLFGGRQKSLGGAHWPACEDTFHHISKTMAAMVLCKNSYLPNKCETSSSQQEMNSSTSVASSSTWREELITKIVYFLRTRVIQINFRNLNIIPNLREQARHKKNGGLGSMLMFGVVAAGLIVIPLGFQFLAVLGGKALLLAKLALILTSIQGLKKIATSNINYGLYSTDTSSPWLYDRKVAYDFDPYQSIYQSSSLGNSPGLDRYVKSSDLTPFYPTINPKDSYTAPKSLLST
ncbi:uncharacterized protein Osi23 [Euwallacea similis]|uniref:uncharacterized protein Osi23 n=1 Tax=Euwallacea similis TaxID=1736056 RepID=UPI00344FFE1E